MNFALTIAVEKVPEGGIESRLIYGHQIASRRLLEAGAGVVLGYTDDPEGATESMADRSIDRIASVADKLKIVTSRLIRPAYTQAGYTEPVHFVCTDSQAGKLLTQWEKWAESERPFTYDPTGYFRDESDFRHDAEIQASVGWWTLDKDLIWTQELTIAEDIVHAFETIGSSSEP